MILNDFVSALSSDINLKVNHLGTKLSSVLIIIYGEEPKILMTRKSLHLKIHAGEIAFPGGKVDESDTDFLHTALRELKEEVNLDISRSQIIGQLESVRTLNSNFTIVPFVCTLDELPNIKHNHEVDEILKIPAESFLKTLQNDPDPKHNKIQEMYTFTFKEHLIWGASARMLKQIVDKLSAKKLL